MCDDVWLSPQTPANITTSTTEQTGHFSIRSLLFDLPCSGRIFKLKYWLSFTCRFFKFIFDSFSLLCLYFFFICLAVWQLFVCLFGLQPRSGLSLCACVSRCFFHFLSNVAQPIVISCQLFHLGGIYYYAAYITFLTSLVFFCSLCLEICVEFTAAPLQCSIRLAPTHDKQAKVWTLSRTNFRKSMQTRLLAAHFFLEHLFNIAIMFKPAQDNWYLSLAGVL